MPCPIPDCIDCEVNAMDCPPESRCPGPRARVCPERADFGSCEHTVTNAETARRKRKVAK